MKLTILIFSITSLICSADESFKQKTDAKPSEIRTEREEKKDADGRVSASIERVYRGGEQILMTIRLKKNHYGVRTIRSYFAKGKIVLEEIDYDDGKPQMIKTYRDDVLCEIFMRQSDGTIKPASADELAKLQSSQRDLMQGGSNEAEKK